MSRQPKITSRAFLREAVKNAFEAHMAADANRQRNTERTEHFLTLSSAVHLVATSSDADLRMLAREADEIGFAKPALADAKQATVRLARWQALLAKQRA